MAELLEQDQITASQEETVAPEVSEAPGTAQDAAAESETVQDAAAGSAEAPAAAFKSPVASGAAPVNPAAAEAAKRAASRRKRRKIIRAVVLVALLAAAGIFAWRYFRNRKGPDSEVVTDVVHYDAIVSTVTGSGLTKAKNSETITIANEGTVQEVLVSEGDLVTAGDPLFVIDSEAARKAVETAKEEVERARDTVRSREKALSDARKQVSELNLTAPHAGKLLDCVKLQSGDPISAGAQIATLADDTRLRLTQYYSYAYAGQLQAGQTMEVSIPSLMSTVSGTVEAVHMVNRITPEGSQLFSADILVTNQGALTADMEASAVAVINGESVYPYESGKLEYFRVSNIVAKVSGKVVSSILLDYLPVSAGQRLVRIDGEDLDSEISAAQDALRSAQEAMEESEKKLETAQKNLANCEATAPIDGQIIGLALQPGDEVNANTAAVTISDTSTVLINATVDERNVSYIKVGMGVDLDQWGTPSFGTVETISLSSTVNNGVATYPFTIIADNMEGEIQVNSYIQYSLTASQNDNCLVLPIQAVRTVGLEDGSTATVVYVEGERPDNAVEVPYVDEEIPEGFWPVPVEIGIQDNYNVEIRSGVEEGTVVFTQMMTAQVWG